MKYLLLATTILAVNASSVYAQKGMSISTHSKEINKSSEDVQLSGEVVEIKPNQAVKAEIKPKNAIEDNTITVTGGTITIKERILGADSIKSSVQNNTVNVSKGNYTANIIGAQSYEKDAINNKVNISDINLTETVFGATSYHGSAIRNKVTISGSTISKRVLGGQSSAKNAENNSVEIISSTLLQPVYGGFSNEGDVLKNSVYIKNSTVSDKLYGGFSRDKNAKNNKLTLDNSDVTNFVYGGASTTGNVSENDLEIISGNIHGEIYGGYSDFGNVSNNTLTIKGGKFSRSVYDGYSKHGKVENNRIVIEGGDFTRTESVISHFITVSGAPTFNSNLTISGRCGDKSPDEIECLVKFVNYKGSAFKTITDAKKVEIDADSTVVLLKGGVNKLNANLDVKGTIGFRHTGNAESKTLVVNDLKADKANFVLSSNDFITVSGKAEGTATVDIYFPYENLITVKPYRIFDGDTFGLDYSLKKNYILSRDGWHSFKIEKNPKQRNYVDVLSKKTIYANDSSLAVPISVNQETVDNIEVVNNGSINLSNGTANFTATTNLIVENGTVNMDYSDYFAIAKDLKATDAKLVINVSSAKVGKYKMFMNNNGETLDTSAFTTSFVDENVALNYKFEKGILEVSEKK